MIPRDFITEWRKQAPWIEDSQVEQDLVISRALVEIFSHPLLRRSLAFRGGTALYKLYIQPSPRYSEDVDLVQIRAEPGGPVMDALREALDPWLGTPSWKQSAGRVTFLYRFRSEGASALPMRLKIEINTREHLSVYGYASVPFAVSSRWFRGECEAVTYELDELLGTKLRALYQRRKGRDLFDLAVALDAGVANPDRVIEAFRAYMAHGGHRVSLAQFDRNLDEKLRNPDFVADIEPLLAEGHEWDSARAVQTVRDRLLARLAE